MVAVSQMHHISFFFFIVYYFSNSGLMSMPLVLLVFLNFLMERRIVMLRVWMISFAYVSALILMKYGILISESALLTNISTIVFNSNLSMMYEAFLIFLIFTSQIISKKYGIDKHDPSSAENTHQAYVRNCINNLDFREDFINFSTTSKIIKTKLKSSALSLLNISKRLLRRLHALPSAFKKRKSTPSEQEQEQQK